MYEAARRALAAERWPAGARSLADSAIIHGLESTLAGHTLTRRRTLSTGCAAVYMSMSVTRGPGAGRSAEKTAGPMVVVASHGVKLLTAIAETSNRKLHGARLRRLNEGTRCRAPCRGVHVGDSSTAVSPSIVTRAESTGRRHAGGIVLATADELIPATAVNRSVATIWLVWLVRKVRHVWDGGRGCRRMYVATVD